MKRDTNTLLSARLRFLWHYKTTDYQSNTDIREKLNVQNIIYKIEELKGIPYNVNYILFVCSLFI
jgi:hypothetical protein